MRFWEFRSIWGFKSCVWNNITSEITDDQIQTLVDKVTKQFNKSPSLIIKNCSMTNLLEKQVIMSRLQNKLSNTHKHFWSINSICMKWNLKSRNYSFSGKSLNGINSMQQVACPARLYPICVRSEIRGFARNVGRVAGWQVSLMQQGMGNRVFGKPEY